MSRFPDDRRSWGSKADVIDKLSTVHDMARVIANLLNDAENTDELDHAERLEQVALEAADTLLSVCEDAVRAMPTSSSQLKAA